MIKKFITHHSSLITILLLAALLRLYGLSDNPPHLTPDEAALGYNAYSILKTGRDEHGELFPMVFKSFGDWKPGLYIYLTVPFVRVLGLTELAVRLPAAISGIVAVFLVWLLVRELFPKVQNFALCTLHFSLAEIAALFLAISPWHIQFSRGAWETGVSLTLTLVGIYFFLLAVKNRPHMFTVAGLFFALTLWTYQGAKLATAIVVFGLLISFWQEISKVSLKILSKSLVISFLVALPVFLSFWQGKTGRLEVYSIFSYERPEETVQELLGQENVSRNSWQYLFYHDEPLNFARGILSRWLNHYSGRFLFFEGDWNNLRHGVPNTGMVLLLDSVLLALGVYGLLQKKERGIRFLWLWLLFATLPAALSRDPVHAVRSLGLVVPLSVLLGVGALVLVKSVSNLKKVAIPVLVVFVVMYLTNYVYYLDQYWVHLPKKNSRYWYYGYKQAVEQISPQQNMYDFIVFQQSYSQPYIFFLFYQKYDPSTYQKISKEVFQPNVVDVGLVSRLENIEFKDATSEDLNKERTLIVYDPERPPFAELSRKPDNAREEEIKRPNGTTAFKLLYFD